MTEDKNPLGLAEIKLVRSGHEFVCEFLNQNNNDCQVYEKRPFECVMYPFLLIRRIDTLDLAAHLACPYVKEMIGYEQFKKYSEYLISYLKEPKMMRTLNDNVEIFYQYPEIELFVIKRDVLEKK